jgi:hypothetical protein
MGYYIAVNTKTRVVDDLLELLYEFRDSPCLFEYNRPLPSIIPQPRADALQ